MSHVQTCIRADAGTNNMSVHLVTEHTGDNYGTCVHCVCVLSMSFMVITWDNCHLGHLAHFAYELADLV